jgi:hypothetical protein
MRQGLAAGAVACACLAGCGGGSDPPRKADYIAEADRICRDFDNELAAIEEPKAVKDISGFADKAAPIARRGIAKLRQLEAPEEFKPEADRMIAGLEEGTRLIEDLSKAAKAQDLDEVRAIGKRATARAGELQREARAAGFTSCGIEDGSSSSS